MPLRRHEDLDLTPTVTPCPPNTDVVGYGVHINVHDAYNTYRYYQNIKYKTVLRTYVMLL